MARAWSTRARAHRELFPDPGNVQRGKDIRRLKRAMRKRARQRDLPMVALNGSYTRRTHKVAKRVALALGVHPSTLAKRDARGREVLTVGAQRVIRRPALRTPAQLARAAAWKRDRKRARGAKQAVRWAQRQAKAGVYENPPGSNRGGKITVWQRDLGDWLIGQAWCGVFVGTALRHAGVDGINYRVASVWFILVDALAGRNGFKECVYRRSTGHGSVLNGQPGDAVGLFSENTHVELIVRRVPGGFDTCGGNTSAGADGSQSNGDGVYRRFRPDSAVVYIARPRW